MIGKGEGADPGHGSTSSKARLWRIHLARLDRLPPPNEWGHYYFGPRDGDMVPAIFRCQAGGPTAGMYMISLGHGGMVWGRVRDHDGERPCLMMFKTPDEALEEMRRILGWKGR
jgi:hypothetical protein